MNPNPWWLTCGLLLAGGVALAGPAEELWVCKPGLAPGPGKPVLIPDEAVAPALRALDTTVPGLLGVLEPLRRDGCTPLAKVMEALQAPPVGSPGGPSCKRPGDPEAEARVVERQLLSKWLTSWRREEAQRRMGTIAFRNLGDSSSLRRLELNDPGALAKYAEFVLQRAKPPADGESLRLPVLLPAASEGLWAQASEAAQEFVAGYAAHRQAWLDELRAREQRIRAELVQDALELNRLAAEASGAQEELRGLGRLETRLFPRVAAGPGAEVLHTTRAQVLDRLLLALRAQTQRARERAERARERCKAEREVAGLEDFPRPLVAHPATPVPAGFAPEAALAVALPEQGDPVAKGVWVLQTRRHKPAASRPAPAKANRPKPPSKQSRLRLEEDGVERSSPGERAAAGRPTPVDAAAATRASHVQACGLGNGSACYQAGLALEGGSGGPRDLHTARRYFQQACDGGFELGCYQLGTYWLSGLGGPRDPELGRALLGRACQAKIQQACRRLESP